MALALRAVEAADFEALLALRIAALRPSLDRLGRFDPLRARARFAAQFEPRWMRWIDRDGAPVGLLTLRKDAQACWHVDHLYIDPAAQGEGLGSWAIGQAKAEAARAGRAMELQALQRSDANRFYLRHGFVLIAEDDLDCYYRWVAPAGTVEQGE
jgi:GNAT superfamily N-acetyltransferase